MSLAQNKKVYHDYFVLETFQAGLVLTGPEVKAVKAGQADLKGSYITIDQNSEAWLNHAYIASYQPAKSMQRKYQTNQTRKLLLNKREISYLLGKEKERGLTIVPLKVYLKNNFIKLEIAVVRGKKQFDKREAIKKKDFERRKQRMIR